MLIDGVAVAKQLQQATAKRIATLSTPPRTAIIACAPNTVTKQYLAIKQTAASELGIELEVQEYAASSTTADLVAAVTKSVDTVDAVVVQLPLPAHIDTATVLSAIPASHDVDGLTPDSPYLSPVVGSIKAMVEQYHIPMRHAQVVVVGAGALVGVPAAVWCAQAGAQVTIATKEAPQPEALAQADVVISGAGVPHLITPDMVKEGVVLFDAGTAEAGGMVRGDVAPVCADKAAFMTPVPGGIGPVTISVLMDNITTAAAARAYES